MRLLMTVQPKNGEKPSDPMLIDSNESDLCRLAGDFLCTGDKVLIFQSVTEYKAAPCGECDDVTPCGECDDVTPCVECYKKE